MAIYNLLGLGVTIGSLAGDKTAEEIAATYFTGTYNNTLGSEGHNVYGQRTSHIFGTDNRLTVGGGLMGLFGPLGIFINEFALIPFGWLGLGDDCSVTYGQKIDVVYGGPNSRIQRGPSITRITHKPLGRKPDVSKLPSDMLQGMFGGKASALLAANQPQDVPTPEQGSANPAAFTTDDRYESLILHLSQFFIVMTGAVDLAIRLKYPKFGFDPQTQSQEKSPVPMILMTAGSTLGSILQGIIYHLEIQSIYGKDLVNSISEAMSTLKYAGTLVIAAALEGGKAIWRFLKRAWHFTTIVVKNVLLLLMNLLIIALILVVATGAIVPLIGALT